MNVVRLQVKCYGLCPLATKNNLSAYYSLAAPHRYEFKKLAPINSKEPVMEILAIDSKLRCY